MYLVVMTVEVMFDVAFDNYGGPSMSSTIRMLGIVYGILGDANEAFRGEMGLRDQHYIHVAEGQVGI